MAITSSKTRINRRRDTRKLFVWLDQVRGDPELSPSAFKVAYEIGQHFNSRHGGAAWPSSLTIATNIGVDKATVIRAVRHLRERGHLKVDPGHAGRGHASRYFMVLRKGPAVDLSEPEKLPPQKVHQRTFSGLIKGALEPRKGAPAHLNYLEPPMGDAKASPIEGERERSRALAVIPAGAPAPVDGAPDGKKAVDRLAVNRFRELLAIWQRPWGEDETAAHRAFVIACREAEPEAIIAASRAWVASADDPRFLKPLATWLAKGLWQKPPPQRRSMRNGGKVSLSALALEIGGWGRS